MQIIVIGSPETLRQVRPRPYPRHQREHWDVPPRRDSKAQALRRLLATINQQNQAVREMLRPDAAMLREWLRAA